MDYKFTFQDGSEALMHYGVKGMKWGVWNAETRARRAGIKSAVAKDAKATYERGEKWTRAQGKAFKKRVIASGNIAIARKAHSSENSLKSAKRLNKAERKSEKAKTRYEETREWNNPGKSKLTYEQFNTFSNKKAYTALGKWAGAAIAGQGAAAGAVSAKLAGLTIFGGAAAPYIAAGGAAVGAVLGASAIKDIYKVSKMSAQRKPTINVETGHPSRKTR